MSVTFINPFIIKPAAASIALAGSSLYRSSADATTHSCSLPSGIQAGDLLLLMCSPRSTGGAATVPSGWTALANETSQFPRLVVFYKIASGTEGTSVSVTLATTSAMVSVAYRVTGAHQTTAPVLGTVSVGTNNPPSLTPSWGSAGTLWVAAVWHSGYTFTSYPTNYTLGQQQGLPTGGTTAVGLAAAARILTAATEDPGAFTLASTTVTRANTIAIRPA